MDLDDDIYIYHIEAKGAMHYQLYEVYKIIDHGHPIIRQVGSWQKDLRSLNFVKENKNARRVDLRVGTYFEIDLGKECRL